MKYSEALALLNGRETKKIANNTYLVHRGEGVIALRLHSTDVLTFRPGSVTYDTGGWRTVTTKARFNKFGPDGVRVYSDKRVWAVYREGEFVEAYEDGFTWYDEPPACVGCKRSDIVIVKDKPCESCLTADDGKGFNPIDPSDMTPYRATMIAEGRHGGCHEPATAAEYYEAWQYLVTSGLAWTLQGWFGRTAVGMIEDGLITR